MMSKIFTLKKRAEFLRVAGQGFKMVTPSIILQAARSLSADSIPAKIGFTVTKKLGNAVVRNRIKRRLRAAVREFSPELLNNTDYVFIGRNSTAEIEFPQLKKDLLFGLEKINLLISKKKNEKDSDFIS